jgi:hypothetical protein
MATGKSKPPKLEPSVGGKWRIVGPDGKDRVPPMASEALARDRWFRISRTRAGEAAKLLRPDGTVDAWRDDDGGTR